MFDIVPFEPIEFIADTNTDQTQVYLHTGKKSLQTMVYTAVIKLATELEFYGKVFRPVELMRGGWFHLSSECEFYFRAAAADGDTSS